MRPRDEVNLRMTTSSNMTDQDSFDGELFELIARYEDDALDEMGLARLNEALVGSERARDLFNDVCLQSLSMGEALELNVSHTVEIPAKGKMIAFPRWAYAVAAAAVVAAMATFTFLHTKDDPSPSDQSVGTIAKGQSNDAEKESKVVPGSRVDTSGNIGFKTLRWEDGSSISLGPDALASFPVGDRKIVKLDRGKLLASVEKQPAAQPFGLMTPHLEITVVGTEFEVSVDDERTSVKVTEGRVRVDYKGAAETLSQGESFVGDSNVAATDSSAVSSGHGNADASTASSSTDTSEIPSIKVKVGQRPVTGSVTLGRAATIRGRALNAQGEPYSKVRISIHPKNNPREIVHETLTGADGRFEIKLRLAGEFLTRIHSDIEVEAVLQLGKTTNLGDLSPAGE